MPDPFHSDDDAVEDMIRAAKKTIAKTRGKLAKMLFDYNLEIPGELPEARITSIATAIKYELRHHPEQLAFLAYVLTQMSKQHDMTEIDKKIPDDVFEQWEAQLLEEDNLVP
jgi:hypothetical protein